jgi:hypothetical protein
MLLRSVGQAKGQMRFELLRGMLQAFEVIRAVTGS